MDLISPFFRLFARPPKQDSDKIREPLPFVKLLGYEKVYGAPQPQDYPRMVEAYKSWVYACANKNAFSVAKCKLSLFKQSDDDDDELEEVKKHPFLDLMKSVNPFSNAFELKSITQIYLELTGNAYWYMPKSVLGIPYMIWVIPSHWMKIIPSVEKFIEGYVMQVPGMGELIPFEESEIVHFKFPSPFNLFYGTGPTLAAAYGIDLNSEIKKWGISYFMNNAQPSGVLTTESSLNSEEYQRLRDNWNRKYRGTENAGKIAILEAGLKYQQVGTTLKDAKIEDVSKEVRDEIMAIFGVPASKLGLVEDVNRANAEANDYTYQKETILPKLTLLEEKINEKIIPMYDPSLICKFENPVPEDRQFRLQEKQINIASGFSSIDEEREAEGLDPYNLPETKVPLIPFGLNPAGTPKPEPVVIPGQAPQEAKAFKQKSQADLHWERFAIATQPQERLFADKMRNYFEDQKSEVMRNFNKFKETNGAITKEASAYIMFNMRQANEKLKATSINSVRQAYTTGLTLGMHATNSSIDFNLFEPNIMNAVKSRIGFFAEKVNESTLSLLQNELEAGFKNGESIEDISKRINNIFRFSEDFRSKRIAQTEIIGATNDGQLRAYSEAGFKAKRWLTARDEKVRESHQIDGQKVPLTETFKTNDGNILLYPGDRSTGAPASDVINCRCTVLPEDNV